MSTNSVDNSTKELKNDWPILVTILSVCDLMNLIQLEKINEHHLVIKFPSAHQGCNDVKIADMKLVDNTIVLNVNDYYCQQSVIVSLLKEACQENCKHAYDGIQHTPTNKFACCNVNWFANSIIKFILPEEDPDCPPHYQRGANTNNRPATDDMAEELEALIERVFSTQFPQEKWVNKSISNNHEYDEDENGTFYGQEIIPVWHVFEESYVKVKNFQTGQMETKITFICACYNSIDFFVLVQELYEDHKLGTNSKYTNFVGLLPV